MNQGIVRWVVPIALAAAYFYRNIDLLLYPTLFGEEGVIFLPRIIYGDWDISCSGYLNTFTYMTMWAASNVTINYLPHVLFFIAFVVNLIPFFYFLLPHWEKLLPYSHRVAFGVLVLLFNPWHEGMCQLLYCFWYLGLGAALLCIEHIYLPDDARRWRLGKIAFVLLAGLSGPVALTLAVALVAGFILATLVECLLSKTSLVGGIKSRLPILLNPIVLCVLITGLVQIGISMSNPETRQQHRLSIRSVLAMPIAAFIQMHVMVVVNYLVPFEWFQEMNAQKWPLWTMLPFTLLLLALPLFEKKAERIGSLPALPPLSWMLGLTVPVLCVLVYAGRIQVVQFFTHFPITVDGPRYSILQGEIFVLAVLVSLTQLRSQRVKVAYLTLFAPLVLIHGIVDFRTRLAREPIKDWKEVAPLIIEFKNGKHTFINEPTRPTSWTVLLQRERMKK